MQKTALDPCSEWSEVLDRMGEWLLVGSIAAIGLPAVPGAISLIALLIFFSLRDQNRHPAGVRGIHAIDHQDLDELEDIDNIHPINFEDLELAKLSPEQVPRQTRRSHATYTVGWVFWIASMIYLIGFKGLYCHDWIPK